MSPKTLWLTVAILWLAALLRIVALSDTSLAHDEMLTYERTQGSLEDRLEHIGGPGNHVPLFFLFTGLLPHGTELELRLGAVWFSLLSLALLMRTARGTYPDSRFILWLGLLLAITPFMVRYGRYARPYPMFFFFSLLTNLYFLRTQTRTTGWWGFGVTSLLTYSIHLGAAALPISQFVILWWARVPRSTWIKWLTVQLIASLPVVIWLATYAQVGSSKMDWIAPPNLGRPYYTMMNLLIGYAMPVQWYFVLVLPVLTAGLFAGLWMAYRAGTLAERYWLVLILLPMLLVFLVSQVKPIYDERYFTAAAPGLFLLTFRGWQKLNWLRPAALYVVIFAGGITLSQLLTTHYERIEWQESIAYVADHIQPEDGILLDAPHWIVFSFYYPSAQNVLQPDTAKALYRQTLCATNLPYERLWFFTEAKPDYTVTNWLAGQNILQVNRYLDMQLYLIETPQQCP